MEPADFVEPMLAQSAPAGSGALELAAQLGTAHWSFEPKLDGLRGVAVRNGPGVNLCSRNRLPFNQRFPAIVEALRGLGVDNFVIDGEVVGAMSGRPSFAALQQGNAESVEYWVFDLPWLLGRDLKHLPLEERRALLNQLVVPNAVVKVVPVLDGEPGRLLADACAGGWEGLVAKRKGSHYCQGRSSDWQKLKCSCRQELVVGGYTAPRNSRSGFGALLLGYYRHGDLVYAGKVGTGFTEALLSSLHRRLVQLARPASPFAGPVGERTARWAEPELVAEVSFTNWTADGKLRHPSFLGLRPDKAPSDVRREPCGPQPRAGGPRPGR